MHSGVRVCEEYGFAYSLASLFLFIYNAFVAASVQNLSRKNIKSNAAYGQGMDKMHREIHRNKHQCHRTYPLEFSKKLKVESIYRYKLSRH